ncbi:gfo/Idh/MocA family oxidoreductase [Aliivibrio fischeri]|uniref:Gfo/Idh/MocA family protein n=1 Tax=Aliivibrio fischeri TaxID=668 RepID=UPI0012DA1DEC|nr:Gfo/Idh/MocA family oxidoreductase [Aliivibrio fischeri]MUK40666.1 gfo/Idh/MocA family oxidoreductase [Aliivibrio fischeri]
MIKLAVIGTNWITERFLAAALESGKYQLSAVYSRSLEQAKAFADKFSVNLTFDCLDKLAACDEVDAVYIASPNSFHAPQSIKMMKHGKHVICEKPIASNYQEAQLAYQTAQENNVVLFEAFMSPYLPNFQQIKSHLPSLGAIRKAHITYCQYSSRYPKYLNGENPNTFNPEFSNGSIMDIGFYCVGSMVELFGEPTSIQAQAHLLDSGVDGNGSIICGYDGFDVVVMHSKTSDSYVPSEIQGEEGAILAEMISIGQKVTKVNRGGETEDLTLEQNTNPMFYEAFKFAEQVKSNQIDMQAVERSLLISKVTTEIRKQTGVVFPADN